MGGDTYATAGGVATIPVSESKPWVRFPPLDRPLLRVLMNGKTTQYGFTWGPVKVERACSDEKKGWVALLVKTKKHPHGIQVYVTKSGKVRVYSGTVEWLPED